VVGLEAEGVGVANQVQPVAAPTLSVTGGTEEAVDQLFVGVAGEGVLRTHAAFFTAGTGGRTGLRKDHQED